MSENYYQILNPKRNRNWYLLSLSKQETTTNFRFLVTEPCFFSLCSLASNFLTVLIGSQFFQFSIVGSICGEIGGQYSKDRVLCAFYFKPRRIVTTKRIVSVPNRQLLDLVVSSLPGCSIRMIITWSHRMRILPNISNRLSRNLNSLRASNWYVLLIKFISRWSLL